MDRISGNIFIRPNPMKLGHILTGHHHNFGHTTFFQAGWHLARRRFLDGTETITQHCSLEYRTTRALLERYDPQSIKRPVRGPDRIEEGRPRFDLRFIAQDEAVPDGFEEIIFDPLGYHVFAEALVEHEFAALSDNAELNCVYSHRTAQGEVTQEYTGFEAAYR